MTPPRIPPLAPADRDERTEELLAPMRRPDGTDLNIFATLAHHPRLLKRWSAFGGTLLYRGRLTDRERELLIMRTAWHCHAHYEWGQHVAFALAAGLSEADIARIADVDDESWAPDDLALLRAADELHRDSRISDGTWTELAGRYDNEQLIEICMVVGQYHLVAFTLNSLGVEPEPGLPEMPAHGEEAR